MIRLYFLLMLPWLLMLCYIILVQDLYFSCSVMFRNRTAKVKMLFFAKNSCWLFLIFLSLTRNLSVAGSRMKEMTCRFSDCWAKPSQEMKIGVHNMLPSRKSVWLDLIIIFNNIHFKNYTYKSSFFLTVGKCSALYITFSFIYLIVHVVCIYITGLQNRLS